MQMYVASTFEIDDTALAVKEIMQGLPTGIIEEAQKKNAVGIVTSHVDALTAGVMQALCAEFPFDIVGMSSFASGGAQKVDMSLLTFTVFLSEDILFATSLSQSIDFEDAASSNCTSALEDAYTNLVEKLGTPPQVLLFYAPFSSTVTGQDITTHLTKISHGVPLFGALASDNTADCSESYVVYNTKFEKNHIALLGMGGPIQPVFYFASLAHDSIRNRKSIITASEGNTVYTVNDMPVMDYIYSLGLSTTDWLEAGTVIPFLVDYKDGAPLVARELFGISPEKHAVFGGEMPVGAQIHLAMQSSESIAQSAQGVVEKILTHKDSAYGALVVTCVGRSLILGGRPLLEAQMCLENIQEQLPCQLVYARGEICPTYLPNGQTQNRFHNFSFVVCVLEKI